MRSRILVGLLAGSLGGLLGWFLQENLINYNALITMQAGVCQEIHNTTAANQAAIVSILCVCGFIGVFLGAVDGIVDRSARKLAMGMAIGVVGAIILGGVGNNLGGMAYNLLGGNHGTLDNPSVFAFTLQIVARAAQVGLWGLGIGTGVAIATLNPKRILYGAIGGLLGGTLTGFVFDLISASTLPVHSALGASGCVDVGGVGRAICFTGIGALTGFFIGLVEELLKQAWVKVLAGRNEGKDFILYKSMNLLGRDERCDVPLFGDPSVGVQHAAIRADGRRHFLLAADTPAGTLVNGQNVTPQSELMLRDGDMIQIGAHRILFHEKATASRLTRPNPDSGLLKKAGRGAVPIPSHLCPFCGSTRDAAGNCRCTLAGGPAVSASMGMASIPVGPDGAPDPYAPGPMPGYSGATAVLGGANGPASLGPPIGQLVGLEGPYGGQVFALQRANMEVGREMGNDIVLSSDSTISRAHARLTREDGHLLVIDLGSSNGTYVNGQRLYSPVALAPGDIVQFGSTKFRYE